MVDIDRDTPEIIGYFYPKYGITFEFSDAEGLYINRIICGEAVEVNGAKSNMDFDQVQKYLGKQTVTKIIDGRTPEKEKKSYELMYKIYDTIVRFDSPNEDGTDSILSISKS